MLAITLTISFPWWAVPLGLLVVSALYGLYCITHF